MKKCNSELMKELKIIREELDERIAKIKNDSYVVYYEGEEEPEKNFNYPEELKEVKRLLEEERKIKALLAYSNATTKLIDYEDMTIGEGLVKLAQLTQLLSNVTRLKRSKQKVKDLYLAKFEGDKDRVKITEYLYDIKEVEQEIKDLKKSIHQLQVAIDRTNLCNMIDID